MRIGMYAVRCDTHGGTESIGPTLAALARGAEDAGVSRFTLMDPWFQMEHMASATDPTLEGFTSLGFVAAAAHYARLGVTTIDVVPTGDPLAFVERVGTELIPHLADLDTAA